MRAPRPIEPIYRTNSPNSPIALGTHRVTLRHGDGVGESADANFVLRLSPYPRLAVSMRLPSSARTDGITAAEIPALRARFSVLPPTQLPAIAGPTLSLHPNPDRIEIFRARFKRIRKVVFHVVNFYDFDLSEHYSVFSTKTVITRLDRVLLTHGSWRVSIQALPETADLVRKLRADSGSAITHVGTIERARHGLFRTRDAEAVLEVVRLFLSFARGSFVSCSLVVGFNGESACWERWGSTLLYSWRGYLGWFSGRPATMLEGVFPGFMDLLQDPLRGASIREVLYWYLRANNSSEGPGVDGGIILAQAALEKLAWIHLVEHQKLVSRTRFDNWGAADRMLNLLVKTGIPTSIPSELKGLTKTARDEGWIDGPTALARIRNDLVHAKKRYMVGAQNPFFEAWSLAQRYIELVILRLSQFNGEYTDRISAGSVGETTKVPWA
jgi:hypothetical protein